MPRDGAISFRDIVGISIATSEADAGVTERPRHRRQVWSDEITADCPQKHSRNLYDQCGARCPYLSKAVRGARPLPATA